MAERLQKILAQADLGSRRSCEEIIRQGRVTVNGAVAKIGQSADADLDEIYVDGNRIRRIRIDRLSISNRVGILSGWTLLCVIRNFYFLCTY